MQDLRSAEDLQIYNPIEGNRITIAPDTPKERITIVKAEQEDRAVRVHWADGHVSRFHYIWLRHNCFCKKCGNSADGIRFILIPDIPKDIRPTSLRLSDLGSLEIKWHNDGHTSSYGPEWLRAYCYSPEERARRSSFKPKTWKSEITQHFPTVDYRAVRAEDAKRLEMYELLRDYGIVKVENVGSAPDETEKLANLIGPIHETTVYGHIYDVQAEPVSKLGAKTAMKQDPHCDDTFYYAPPGIDIFHCLVNTMGGGGESVYVDGFAIAESLRTEEPEAFELLTTVPIKFNRRHPGEVDIRCRGHVIQLDNDSNLAGIRYFDRAVAPLDVPDELVEPMFEAQRKFIERMISPAFKAEFFVESGTGMLIDNQRAMHGRNAFDSHSGRRIRLCHVDRDEFHARLRDLGHRLGRQDYDIFLPPGVSAV